MKETEQIISILPAPAGLWVVYRPTKQARENGETEEYGEPVACLALIQEDHYTHTTREIVAMAICDVGNLEIVDAATNFDRIEWRRKPCKCSTPAP